MHACVSVCVYVCIVYTQVYSDLKTSGTIREVAFQTNHADSHLPFIGLSSVFPGPLGELAPLIWWADWRQHPFLNSVLYMQNKDQLPVGTL